MLEHKSRLAKFHIITAVVCCQANETIQSSWTELFGVQNFCGKRFLLIYLEFFISFFICFTSCHLVVDVSELDPV